MSVHCVYSQAEYYFRARSYSDALNSLCGSVSVQPLALHSLIDRLHPAAGAVNTPEGVTASSVDATSTSKSGTAAGPTASRLNNAACALLRSDKPSMAVLLLRQGLHIDANDSLPDGATTINVRGGDQLRYSDTYRGSLHRPNSTALQYNLAVALLRQNRPLEALHQLQGLQGSEVEGRPYIWLRRAECCILHYHLLVSSTQGHGGGGSVAGSVIGSGSAVVAKLVGEGQLQKVQIG
jgi:predicted Zn-dependent protease